MDPHVDDGQLNALLDGELDAAERQAVETHLAACAECRARYAEARAFLAKAGDLLGLLDAPAAPAPTEVPSAKPATIPAQQRPAPTAQEAAVVLPGPGVARTVKEQAVDPASRVARTGKELAVDPAAAPAVRPIFAQTQRSESAPAPRHPWGVPRLAWAAMLVIGVGAGWMANEALRRPAPQTDLAAGPSEPQPVADASKAPVAVAPPAAATTAPAARRPGARSPLVKPRPMRGDKPPSADEAAARIPLERPSGAARNDAELAAAAPSAAGAGVATQRPAPTAGVGGLAAAPVTPPSAAAPAAAARTTARDAAAQPARAAEEAPLSSFHRITMDDAVRRLSGSIRLIDGLQPGRVEVGPGSLVSGATSDREVVRVYYADEAGRSLVLDQQPGDTPNALSVNGLMRGDTLVTETPDGSVRVRWVDRKSFWLSLTGTGSVDSVRTLVERIR